MARVDDILCQHHEELDFLLSQLLERIEAADLGGADELWARVVRELYAHMDAEEAVIIPHIDSRAPNDAAQFRADHDRIRATLAEMGVAVALQTITPEKLRAFVQLLREHAIKEEHSIYPFADRALTEEQQGKLLSWIGKGGGVANVPVGLNR